MCPLSFLSKNVGAIAIGHLQKRMDPIATFFERVAHENTTKSRAILVQADPVTDALNLDHTLLDGLLAE
jgi:hypothetical protein